MTDKKVKVTVEYEGETIVFEGYSLLASLIALPRNAPVQGVQLLHFGRLSAGDYLSAVVSSIAQARKELKLHPVQIRTMMLDMAIQEGLNGGLK